MSPNVPSYLSLLVVHLWCCCSAGLCNWSGSGLSAGPGSEQEDSRMVLQVRLRCTEGRVEWFYPGVLRALRVVLEPNLSYAHPHGTVCVKPFRGGGLGGGASGASMYIERSSGELELLMTDAGDIGDGGRPGAEQVFCYRADGGPHRPAIYLQASPPTQSDVSRRVVGFRYELLGRNSSAPPAASHLLLGRRGGGVLNTACRPCSDAELLLAICNSDFVVRGYIRNVSHDRRQQTSFVEVSGGRVYRQRSGAFQREEEEEEGVLAAERRRGSRPGLEPGAPIRTPSWRGSVRTLLQCGVRPGGGRFLFTGSEHFGEAWLGCAPRYKDFLSLYRSARTAGRTSCDFPVD